MNSLFSHEGNVLYRIPPYQREYSWHTPQWEDLFEYLIDADGAHFLGTIITLDQTTDALEGSILQVVDGQQRLTTLTPLHIVTNERDLAEFRHSWVSGRVVI
ncbi:MAG: DUF262 domain-containing protein [Propioniciclava sp.]